jgi:hypothetical protein
MSTLPTSAVEDVTVANGVRFRVSSGRACEVTIGHFIEFGCDGAKAQVLCAVQRGKGDVQMVVWLFKPLREGPENPTIDDSTGHEHLKRHSGAGSIILVDAASVQRRLHVVPFWAGIGIDLHWRPSQLTTYVVNDFVTHLEPIRGVKVAGSKPLRICPNCTTRVAQPLATETHVECDECSIRFRW